MRTVISLFKTRRHELAVMTVYRSAVFPQDVLHSDWQRSDPAERHRHKWLPDTERGESVHERAGVPVTLGSKLVFLSPSKEIPVQYLH
jgi:hypothetical protein